MSPRSVIGQPRPVSFMAGLKAEAKAALKAIPADQDELDLVQRHKAPTPSDAGVDAAPVVRLGKRRDQHRKWGAIAMGAGITINLLGGPLVLDMGLLAATVGLFVSAERATRQIGLVQTALAGLTGGRLNFMQQRGHQSVPAAELLQQAAKVSPGELTGAITELKQARKRKP